METSELSTNMRFEALFIVECLDFVGKGAAADRDGRHWSGIGWRTRGEETPPGSHPQSPGRQTATGREDQSIDCLRYLSSVSDENSR